MLAIAHYSAIALEKIEFGVLVGSSEQVFAAGTFSSNTYRNCVRGPILFIEGAYSKPHGSTS